VWNEVLQDAFSSDVQGIDCVLQSDLEIHTYTIVDGIARYVGEGDLHDREYDRFRRSVNLTPHEYFSNSSANYTLSVYPSNTFYKVYITSIATVVALGAVGIIVFVSFLFCLYDSCVRRDITAKSQLLDAKRAFVRFVSHEVRTPLNSVCMGLELMQDEIAKSVGCKSVDQLIAKAKEDEKHPEATNKHSGPVARFRLSQEIQSNVLRSVGVLNDLLNYDKIEVGNLTLELAVIDVQDLIESTTNEFAVAASQKKLALTVDFEQVDADLKAAQASTSFDGPTSSRDCRTVGDEIRLRQVMRNLLSNAIKFTPENGEIQVFASWVASGGPREQRTLSKFTLSNGVELSTPRCGWLKVRVIDSGAGMTADQLSKVFGVGVQFNANELQGGNGTGLGLHIAKGIMEQHRGTLRVSSAGLGRGSVFTLKIPIHNATSDNDRSASFGSTERRRSLSGTIPTDFEASPLKILIVDDAAMNRKLLARLLRNRGHQCDEAEDGDVAVRLVKQGIADSQPYDTVLLDNDMPVMDGPTAAEHVRGMGSDVFIVGITGNLLPEDVAHFKEKGANYILPKPFKLSDLESLWVEYDIYTLVANR
jgi:signal transduction histidine kinase/CheY-like chemotaxis protein